MREYSGGPGVELPPGRGIHSVVEFGAREDPNRIVFGRLTESGWQDVTFGQFAVDVRSVASGLIGSDVRPGDRIAVQGRTSYEWAVVNFAAAAAGAVVVPLFPTASAEQLSHIVRDSGAAWAFAETDEQRAVLTDLPDASWRERPWPLVGVHLWAVGRARVDSQATFAERSGAVRADDPATIIYTSGTTGLPKGCLLTHRNLYAASANTVEHTGPLLRTVDDDLGGPVAQPSTLLCLPLAHVFGQTVLLACLYAGVRTGLLPNLPDLFVQLPRYRPTFLAIVPYGLEKIRKGLRAAGVAPDAERAAIAHGRDPSAPLPAGQEWVQAALGGRLRYVLAGGASLDETTADFFRGFGVRILGCYGLSEAATAVTVSSPLTNRPGTVGRPIPGTTVRIAADGEILVRGGNVSPGYWPSPAGERAEGWLHTGDLGELDDHGYLRVTGRAKEIVVTSGGKNVAPAPLEDRVRLHPLVSNCMVVGESRPYVGALVTLDPAALHTWAAEHGLDGVDVDDAALRAAVQVAIDDANTLVSRAESIRRFAIVPGDFTVAGGQLTPSLKLRRTVIEKDFGTAVAALYP